MAEAYFKEKSLKVVLYRGNAYPRSISLNTKFLTRLGIASASICILSIIAWIALIHFSIRGKSAPSNSSQDIHKSDNAEQFGPFNSADEHIRSLKDQIDQLEAKLKNQTTQAEESKSATVKHPVLALFSPVVTDHTKDQDQVTAKNFSFSGGSHKEPATLTFELHNNHPDTSVQKGYIVVLAKSSNGLKAYPDVLNSKGAYLIDFEKGESFQVARFRMVNAQFDFSDAKEPKRSFQVLIFKRTGELLLNLLTEVSEK